MDELLVRPWVCEFDRDRGTIHNRNQVTRFSSQRSQERVYAQECLVNDILVVFCKT